MAWNEVQEIERLNKEYDEEGSNWNMQLNQRASLQGFATCFCLDQKKEYVGEENWKD